MSSISPNKSPTNADEQALEKGDDTPKVTRGAILFDNPRFCMNLLSSFDDSNEIKDVDYTSSSSSSGIVSSSTVEKEYLDDCGSNLGEYTNADYPIASSNTDCLAYRRPWATPPTAPSESSKLQIGGVASPTSSISQRSFQGDNPAFHYAETRKFARNFRNNDATQDTNDTSLYPLRNRPQTTQGNNRRTGVQSPPPKFTSGGSTEGEFIIGDLGETFRNWEETTSTTSYMEQLLRDGGDLDSMDRSLLDYNAMRNVNTVKCGTGNSPGITSNVTTNENGMRITSPTGIVSSQLPIPTHQLSQASNNLASCHPSLTPVTPPVSPCSPLPPPPMLQDNGHGMDITGDLLMDVEHIVKKDLVVRFTEQQNAVHHTTSAMPTSLENRNTSSVTEGVQQLQQKHQQQVQYHQEVTPSKQSLKCRLISDDDSENNHAMDGAQFSEGEPPSEDFADTPGKSASTNLFLYQDDAQRPQMASAISSMANYSAVIQTGPVDPDAKPVVSANLGTLMGVYLPCIQNIFGVILFIRMTWIVGTAGAIEGFFVVFAGCIVTMLTAISMAAIATNGVVPAGGSYFMISRALGPEFGGAVGILFYLATSVAAAMYIIGAVEILITYIVGPPMSLFGPDLTDNSIKFNNFRVYGSGLLVIMGTIVFLGVKFVNKFASVALACVLLTILSIYVGIAVNANGNHNADFCMVGSRIVTKVQNCSKEFDTDLYHNFCKLNETQYKDHEHVKSNNISILTSHFTKDDFICDDYFNNVKNEAKMQQGIRGMTSNAFHENVFNKYKDQGDAIANSTEEKEFNLGGNPKMGYIIADIFTSFTLLVGIFFPSCTGIMAGSNRSGDLGDPQKSIPIGTICAICTTSTVYLSSVLLFAATVDPLLLRDKFGESIGGSLVVGNIAWPHPKVVEIGSLLSTIGAGLQSLTGAPRLLQAISKDGIIPFIDPFRITTASGEPARALLLTCCICEVAVLIGNVDEIAPLLSMFFLMCYGFVNLACALQTLLRTPNWRPRFRYYHWSLSLIGVCLCLAVMFMSSWYYALLAMGIAGVIYKYIEYRGAEKEWGDGLRGLALSAARFSLLRLEEGPPHTKNWRPQIMILAKLDSKLSVKYKRMFSLASQLKAGKGLTIGVTVIEGTFDKMYGEAQAARLSLSQGIKDEGVKGFPDVVVSQNVSAGICHLIQTAGLGGMKPNTIILGWPNSWRKKEEDSWRVFVDAIRNTAAAKMALLVPKGITRFPASGDKISGTIDIWWIVHDGGLLMLLPFLLKQHRTWKNCKLRIFSVAQPEDNSIQMKKDLKTFLYHLRIEADVDVVEMHDSDISDYTYERTLLMEQRNDMLKEMRLSDKKRGRMETGAKLVRKLSLMKNEPDFKIVDDMIIPTDKMDENIEVDEIISRHVETIMENSRGEARGIPKSSPSKVDREISRESGNSLGVPQNKRTESSNVRRMHTAVRLNEAIVNKSHEAKLVILNLPSPPKAIGQDRDSNYMEFLEVLTEGLERVLMVRGGGREVITIYS